MAIVKIEAKIQGKRAPGALNGSTTQYTFLGKSAADAARLAEWADENWPGRVTLRTETIEVSSLEDMKEVIQFEATR